MAPVILSMDVHCHNCAKKIRKAAMKLPGVDSVNFGTGLVVIEGTADAAALRARLQGKTRKAVNVVSDGVEGGDEAASSGSGYASPPPRAPIVLEMELHCRSCAKKVEKRVIPDVDTVTTDVGASRVEVTGTADASAVATSLQVRARSSVRVVSDSRAPAPSPFPPAQPAGSSYPHPWPPLQSYGAPPPQVAGAGYYYPALGVYAGQYWAATPSQPPVGFYTAGQWPAYPPPEGYYPWQGGEVYGGQQMCAPFQQEENPHSCYVQ